MLGRQQDLEVLVLLPIDMWARKQRVLTLSEDPASLARKITQGDLVPLDCARLGLSQLGDVLRDWVIQVHVLLHQHAQNRKHLGDGCDPKHSVAIDSGRLFEVLGGVMGSP